MIMKKKLLIVGLLLGCIFCIGEIGKKTMVEYRGLEKSQTQSTKMIVDAEKGGSDYTVKAENIISLADYEYIEEVSISNDYFISDSIGEMSDVSDNIVNAEVIKVEYLSINGNAWTKVDIKLNSVYKGDLRKGDCITIYQSGGYQPLESHIAFYDDAFRYSHLSDEEIKQTLLHEIPDEEADTEVGSEAIYLLRKSTEEFLPDGVYVRVRGKYATLIDMEDNTYRCYNDTNKKGYQDRSLHEIKKHFLKRFE